VDRRLHLPQIVGVAWHGATVRASEVQRSITSLTTFLNSFTELMAMCEPVDTYGVYPTWRPKGGRAPEATAAFFDTSRLAGRAVSAFETAGISIRYGSSVSANPAVIWTTMFERAAMLEPRQLYALGQQALGILDQKLDRQRGRERGMIGGLGRFFTIPSQIRGAAGLTPGSRAGWFVASLAGILQTVVSGLLVYAVVQVLGGY